MLTFSLRPPQSLSDKNGSSTFTKLFAQPVAGLNNFPKGGRLPQDLFNAQTKKDRSTSEINAFNFFMIEQIFYVIKTINKIRKCRFIFCFKNYCLSKGISMT